MDFVNSRFCSTFFGSQVPSIIKQLTRIADSLEKIAENGQNLNNKANNEVK